MNFDFWQQWGAALDDESFANAWAALGVVGATGAPLFSGTAQQIRVDAGAVAWRFPERSDDLAGTPVEWARAWETMSGRLPLPLRLRASGGPQDRPIGPWYRLLREARPVPEAVSLRIEAPQAELFVDWPLRFAALPENDGRMLDALIERDGFLRDRMRFMQLDRGRSNCDFLIHRGPPATLLRQLLERPWPIKTDILVLAGGAEGNWGEAWSLLAAALARTKASGFVLCPAGLTTEQLGAFMGETVLALSHALPMDVALATGLRKTGITDSVISLTDGIADFSVRNLVDRCNARLAALPRGTQLDPSRLGRLNSIRARAMQRAEPPGGRQFAMFARRLSLPAAALPIEAAGLQLDAETLSFRHESEGGAVLAEVGAATAGAEPPPEARQARAARYLRQRSFVGRHLERREATTGFVAGQPAAVRVWIGGPARGGDALPTPFPVETLPPHLESWTLTIWLSEPEHLPVPLKRQIELPRDGDSTECEFHFVPKDLPEFAARLTVLHRGRVVQTAILVAGVGSADRPGEARGAPKLEEVAVVRARLGDLQDRRRYDLAFVANHDTLGRPLLTAVATDAAWVKDLSQMPALARDINGLLSRVGRSQEDFAGGLEGEAGRTLFVELAQHGGALRSFLNLALDDPENHGTVAANEYIQIVSTRAEAVVPLEFVYDRTVPEDGAKVCPKWKEALEGKCPAKCRRAAARLVCPLGFWGLSKVIERHAVRPGLARDGNILYLQAEAAAGRDTLHLGGAAVLAASERTPEADVAKVRDTLARCCGAGPLWAANWTQWERLVKANRPSLLVALAHTGGTRANVTLAIGSGKGKKTITLRDTHIFPPPTEGRQAPLLALIGCDTTGTADEYGNHVLFLRERGAAVVIGTIATVFGPHAAAVAVDLIEGLFDASRTGPVSLGELIRAVRRNSLRDGQLMPLCLVAYGDADWLLSATLAPTP
jgi:hypothetical protein